MLLQNARAEAFIPYDHLEDDPRRFEIVERRMTRFVGQGGLCERYEQRGDHLVQFGELVDLLPDIVPGLNRDAVIRRFLFSIRNHGFGRHGRRQTIDQLIDLDAWSYYPRGRYSLRPGGLRAESSPELMRAPCSVWAQWLAAQGWPIPPELGRLTLTETTAVDVRTTQAALPAPPVAVTAKITTKPSQEVLNRALQQLAEQRGEKLKQGDQEGDALLRKLGASARQIRTAYQALPKEYRYFRGKPR